MKVVTVVTNEDLQAIPKKCVVISNKRLQRPYTDLHYILLLCTFHRERCR